MSYLFRRSQDEREVESKTTTKLKRKKKESEKEISVGKRSGKDKRRPIKGGKEKVFFFFFKLFVT